MEQKDIKSEKLQRLMRAALNAVGSIDTDMLDALKRAENEKEFIHNWYYNLRSEINREIGFYNDLAKEQGWEGFQLVEVKVCQ
jgi:hypothetical protein